MLQNLHVKNLALITETEVEFKEGLNILTGETGAGKSIIIGSVALALGEKVPKELLRDNEETALVELVFSVENPKVLDAIRQLGIETEDETVILSRKITSGRAIARINGEAVSASRLKEVASLLIDIHGQHEHQSLLSKKKHLEILDAYAKDALGEKKERLAACYQEYRKLKKEWESSSLDTEAPESCRFLRMKSRKSKRHSFPSGRIPGWKNSIADLQTQKRSWMPYRLPVQLPGETAVPERTHRNLSAVPCGKSVRFRHMRSALRRWNRCLPILIIC